MSEQVYIDPPSGRRYLLGLGGLPQWLDAPNVPVSNASAPNMSASNVLAPQLSGFSKALEMASLMLAGIGLFWSAIPLINNVAFVFALLAAFGALMTRVRIGRFGWAAMATLMVAGVTLATVILTQMWFRHSLEGFFGTPGV